MKLVLVAGLIVSPAIAFAQAEAACVTAVQGLEQIAADAEGLVDMEAERHRDLVAMADRIGGQDGAALASLADRQLQDAIDAMIALRRDAMDAEREVTAYCAP
jgi:hypothetical protein